VEIKEEWHSIEITEFWRQTSENWTICREMLR